MNLSPPEKEKIRKRLQTLFQKQGSVKKSVAGKSNEIGQRASIESTTVKNKLPKDQQKLGNEINPKDFKTKNLKKDQQYQHKTKTPTSKQNGFGNFSEKSERHVLQQNNQAKTQLNNGNSADVKPNKHYSLKQASSPVNPSKMHQRKKPKEQGKLEDEFKRSKMKSRSLSKNQLRDVLTETKLKNKNDTTTQNNEDHLLKRNVGQQKLKKVDKQIENNSKSKKTKRNKNLANQQENCSKSEQKSISKDCDAATRNDSKYNKQKQKKPKKRAVSPEVTHNEYVVHKKKQKLSKPKHKTKKYNQQNESEIDADGISSFLQSEDEYDVNGITGYVPGGDFGSDCEQEEMTNCYWMQNDYHSSDNESEDKHSMRKYTEDETSFGEYSTNGTSDSEEVPDSYSDIDETDYEHEEYSSDYLTDDDDDDSFYFNDMSYDFSDNENDDDYELPQNVPEDLIIHRGTAITRNLKPEDNVRFEENRDECQIVELDIQDTVKVIHQPGGYEKEELLKLKYEHNSEIPTQLQKPVITESSPEDCPQLVPIVDADGFQQHIPTEMCSDEEYDSMEDVSLGSEYTEIDSDDAYSLASQDINDKYLRKSSECFESDSADENICEEGNSMEVIDARSCHFGSQPLHTNDASEPSLTDDISQIPSFQLNANINLGSVFVNGKLFSDMDSAVENTETQEAPTEKSAKGVFKKDEDKSENENETSSRPIKISAQSLVNFNTRFFNAFNSNAVIVLVKDPFYIYGTVRLTLLAGPIAIYGHPLAPNTEVEIFSPRGCSVIEISSSSHAKSNISNENLREIFKPYEKTFALSDLNKILRLYNREKDAVVLLKRNDSRKKLVQQFKKFMNENVFPNINNINVDRPLYNSEYLLRCMINTSVPEEKCLRLPKQWQVLNLTHTSRVMLTGGKSVGKSTLLRYLINRHLPQKVLLIDLDIGQPEVFVPQTISCAIVKQPLLGPGFFLNLQPEIAYAVGHSNIALCAPKYFDAVRSLIAHCKSIEEYQDMPWLINTMGYNKGFGLELISFIAQELSSLTDVVQLQSSKNINNFDSILYPHVLMSVPRILFSQENGQQDSINGKLDYRLHVWQSAVEQKSRYQQDWEMSAKDLRFAMFLARLSEALQGHADCLTDIKPFSAPLNELKIVNLMDNMPLLTAEQLAKVIEANLVYLCHYEDDSKPLRCLGIGIVRAVDFHVNQLYLIPALPDTQLKTLNCLAIGEFPLPTSLFTNQGPRVKSVAPFVYNTIEANASKAVKQIYHRPRKFLTGSHKPLD